MVVLQGRFFLRRMINLPCAFRPNDHLIRLNEEFFLDLAWKKEVFQSWDGCSFLQYHQGPAPRCLQMPLGLLVKEQFSRVTGFQAHGSKNRSLSPSSTRTFSLSSWQPTSRVFPWAFKRVNFLSDNHSVVAILRSDT